MAPGLAWGQPGSPAGPVPAELLAARRSALARLVGEGVVVVRSAEERGEAAYAQDSDYRESSDFFYLTGLEAPGGWLVVVAQRAGPDRSILYLPRRDPRQEMWTGPRPGPSADTEKMTGIADVRAVTGLEADLQGVRAESPGDTVWALLERAGSAACGRTQGDARVCAPALAELGAPEPGALRDVRPVLTRLRSVKDEEERRRLRRAVEITAEAQRQALAALRPGVWEYELEALIEYTFRRLGAERLGFPSIVGSGPFSTVLHYDENRRRMEAGDLVVVDVGAEYGYYTADVTRTYPVSGTFTPRQRALYELVLGAQQAAIDAVRPGVTLAELTRIAQQHLRRHSGRLCGARTCETYFVHGLSHHIGLEVHDPAPGGPLQAGMVITIEPGIYLPLEQLGIRIEDDVLVTDAGHEVLSGAAPRRAADIERAMQGAERRSVVERPPGIH